jgi:hypothetical protein
MYLMINILNTRYHFTITKQNIIIHQGLDDNDNKRKNSYSKYSFITNLRIYYSTTTIQKHWSELISVGLNRRNIFN